MRSLSAGGAAACCLFSLAFALASAAPAQETRPLTPEEYAQIRARARAARPADRPQAALLLAPRLSAALPVAGTPIGPSFGLDVEYVTPFLERRLTVAALGQWTGLSLQHPAMFVGDAGYQSSVRQTSGVLAAMLRTTGLGSGGEAYVGAGPGLFLTTVTTQFGAGKRGEHDLRGGVAGLAGVDLYAGPGSIFFELHAQYAPSTLPALSRGSVVPLSFGIGYRFVIPR